MVMKLFRQNFNENFDVELFPFSSNWITHQHTTLNYSLLED